MRCGSVLFGLVESVARCGSVWFGAVLSVWFGLVRCGSVWFGVGRFSPAWFGVVRFRTATTVFNKPTSTFSWYNTFFDSLHWHSIVHFANVTSKVQHLPVCVHDCLNHQYTVGGWESPSTNLTLPPIAESKAKTHKHLTFKLGHPSFRLGPNFRNHQACRAWMGARLPFRNTYHKGFSLFMGQTPRYYAPDEISCLFWWADHYSRSHSH